MVEFANGTCFGVDCIGSYPMVRKSVCYSIDCPSGSSFFQVNTSVKACDQFLHLVKSRIQIEEMYGQSLAKLSAHTIDTFPGSLQDCFEQLKV
jgi:hypothetical protein